MIKQVSKEYQCDFRMYANNSKCQMSQSLKVQPTFPPYPFDKNQWYLCLALMIDVG